MKNLALIAAALLVSSFVQASNMDGYRKMQKEGCGALVMKAKDAGDTNLLNGFSADQFMSKCAQRGEYFLHNMPPTQKEDLAKYDVSFIQTICMGPVSPDLYNNPSDWVRDRIGCIHAMLNNSPNKVFKDLAQYTPTSKTERKPISDVEASRDVLHDYEHQLNLVLYGTAK
jgi:hypothetical protein